MNLQPADGPMRCPRYHSCSAPVCPLDPNHLRAAHLPGEPVCLYLREAVKPDGFAVLSGALREELAKEVSQALIGIIARHGSIRHALERAKKTGSKTLAAQALRASSFGQMCSVN